MLAALGAGLFPQEPLRVLAERRLQHSLGPGCHLRRLHVVPFLLSAEIGGLQLSTSSADVTIARLEVRLSARTLLGHIIAVRRLAVVEPKLELHGGASEPEEAPMTLPEIRVDSLEIRDGRLTITAADGTRLASVLGLRVTGSVGKEALAIDADRIETPYTPVAALQARVRVSSRFDLDIESAQLRTRGSRIRLAGRWPDVMATPSPSDLRFDAALDLTEVPSEYLEAHGRLSLDGTLTGSEAGPKITLRAHGDGPLVAAGVTIEQLGVEGRHDETGDHVHADVHTKDGGQVTLAGTLDNGRLDATARIAHLSPAVWPEDLGLPAGARLDGRVRAHGALDGDIQTSVVATAQGDLPQGHAELHVESQGQVRPSKRELDVAWTIEGRLGAGTTGPVREAHVLAQGSASGPWPPMVEGRLNVDSRVATAAGDQALALLGGLRYSDAGVEIVLTGSGLGGELEGTFDLRGDRIHAAHLHLAGLDLARFDPRLRGTLTLEGDASGPVSAPHHVLVIDGQGMAWSGVAIGPVIGRTTGEGVKGELDLSLPDLHAVSTGSWTRSNAQVTVRLDGTPLEPLAVLTGSPLSGSTTARLDADIPWANPRRAGARLEVTALAAESSGVRVTLERPWLAHLQGQHLTLEALSLSGPGTSFETEGALVLGETIGLDLRTRLVSELTDLPVPKDWALAGSLTGAAHLTGTASAPHAEGDLRWNGVAVRGPSLPSLTVNDGALQLDGRDIRVPELTVLLADGRLDAQATVPLALLSGPTPSEQDSAATASVHWHDIDLAKLLAAVLTDPPEIRGTAAGDVELRVPTADLKRIEARLALPETPLTFGDTSLILEPTQVSLQRHVVATDGLALRSGSARLLSKGRVDLETGALTLRSEGLLDLRPLSSFLTDTALTGRAQLDLTVGGTLEQPAPRGGVSFQDVAVRTRSFPQPITGLHGRIDFADNLLTLAGVEAQLGGGELTATGSARIAASSVEAVKVDVIGKDLALSYPEGLRSRLDVDLRLRGALGNLVLGGNVRVQRGLYTLDLATEKTFMAAAPAVVTSPALRGVRLDIGIDLVRPVRVRNDVAHLTADGRLDLRGTLEWPEPYGHLEIVTPGAQLFFQGRAFDVESGRLSYDGTWVPSIDLVATTPVLITDAETSYETQVRTEAHGTSTDITEAWVARLAGSNDPSLDPIVKLSSSSQLTAQQLANYLSTGRADLRGQEARAVGEQAATLVANRLAGLTLRGLGLDEVRFQPELAARDATPGARFTFGKRFGSRIRVIYSQSLEDAESSFFQIEASPLATTQATLIRNNDGTYVYGAGQRLSLGGAKTQRGPKEHEERQRIAAVNVNGTAPLPDQRVQKALRLSRGDRTTAWAVQDAAERLRAQLVAAGYIEAQVDGDLADDVVTFNVNAGPHFTTEITGLPNPPDIHAVLLKSLFEDEALDRCREAILTRLWRRGYLHAEIVASARGDETERVLHFAVSPGKQWTDAQISFPGATAASNAQLRAACGGIGAAIQAPDACRQRIEDLYQKRHYLRAQVAMPRVQERSDQIRVEVPVSEGTPAIVKSVAVKGIDDPGERKAVADLLRLEGEPYADQSLIAAMQRVRTHFLESGHPYVRVLPQLEAHQGDYDATVEVVPGERVIIRSIEVEGASGGQAARLRSRSGLQVGEPLDPRQLAIAERRLSAAGDLARVSVVVGDDDPSTVRIVVTRAARAQVGYDVRYSDRDHTTGLVDGELRNLPLGSTLGARYRRGGKLAETRGSLFIPGLGGRGLTLVGYKLHEDLSFEDPDFGEVTILRDQLVTQLQQSWSLPNRWNMIGAYQFKRVTVTDLASVRVASLSLTFLRDTRDNPMDAHRGRFWSVNLDLSDGRLGSDASYLKGFAQAFFNRPLAPGLQWSQGFRLGLAHTFDGEPLISFERFYAGGSNSVRGFATDSIGPLDFLEQATGGQATFVVNEELRYRHRSGLGAAAFYDLGNVFETVGEVRLNARHAVGLGLRYASPLGLVRVDLGFPIARREGEKPHQLFISLGQAF